MSIRAGWVAAVLSSLFGAGGARAEAQPTRVELRWNAPRECPDALALVRAVEDFLGQPVAEAGEQQVAVDARVHGDATQGYAARLSFVTTQGKTERDLEHQDCQKLMEGVALLVALAIDPERVGARQDAKDAAEPVAPAAEPQPRKAAEPPALAAPVSTSAVRVAPPFSPPHDRAQTRREVRPSVALLGLAGDGLLPALTPGLGLELGLKRDVFEAAIIARSWGSRSTRVPGVDRASVEVSLLTGGLRLCVVPFHESWSLLACARGDLGQMSATGEFVENAQSPNDGFGALGGSLGVAYEVGRFSPRAGADLMWTASRARFGIRRNGEDQQVFQPRAWHLTGFVGLAYLL
jgi:hypothetical protein